MTEQLWIAVGIAAGGLVVGFLAGRMGATRARIDELRQQVETLTKEREHALAEVEARKEEIAGYRQKVADHFSGTSDLLRDLTLQYRAVYDHLAEGASALCPDQATQLAEGFKREALPASSEAASEEESESSA